MNYPHCIRLRGPWDCKPLAATADHAAPPARRVTPPLRLRDLGLPETAGQMRLARRFGYPGRIDTYEHVWLTLAAVAGCAAVTLNGQSLARGAIGDLEFEITSMLAPHNRLEVVLDAGSEGAGLGEVALEIRRDAFLRDVRAQQEGDGAVRITGMVVGSSSLPLELYVLAGNQHVCYSVTEARPGGQPFVLGFTPGTPLQDTPLQDTPLQHVRIELVCVAERWYAVDVPIENLPGR